MFNNSTPLTMPVAPIGYGYGNGGGLGGFGSDWIGLIVILAILGWGGNGFGFGGFGGCGDTGLGRDGIGDVYHALDKQTKRQESQHTAEGHSQRRGEEGSPAAAAPPFSIFFRH